MKAWVADLMIGAFAVRAQGLITRNPADFKKFYPGLNLLGPGSQREEYAGG